jgi:DNA-nicking Smr family endonuclease
MSRRRPLSEDEHALWTGFTRSIKPLQRVRSLAKSAGAAMLSTADAKAQPVSTPRSSADQEKPPAARKPPPLAPLERRFKQRVARGRDLIDARLDLHGFTQREAHAALLRFLRAAQADGARVALIVTGKGRGKGAAAHERGVLRRQVPMWLSTPEFRSLVVGFDDAHIGHGGDGALYVRLRRAR